MPNNELITILTAPLTPAVGAMFIIIGLYSLTFNVNNAKYKNHQRSEKVARIGGWFYIISGAALIAQTFF